VKNKNIALVRAESEYLPFVQDAFDKVLCIEVMHHLENLAECKRTIKEIGRVSRSGALITFHHKDYSTIFEKINGKPVENEVMIFDETEVNEMLKEAGFSPTKMKIHRSGDMWQIPIYEPWPYDIPPYETKAVMQVECNKS
jgi:2-polyprenyl-3-methyl-5-hydroxy-6-metoxy-1,4-benzoquinol methylase